MADRWFDPEEGERLKVEGIDLVFGHTVTWQAAMIPVVIAHAPWDQDFMAELFYTFPGFEAPPKPQAMGALINHLVRMHIIEHTGRFGRSERSRNHQHPYAIYRRCRWRPPKWLR